MRCLTLSRYIIIYVHSAHQKSNPLGKFDIFGVNFFSQIYRAYRGGFRPNIQQVSLHYLVAFKNYRSNFDDETSAGQRSSSPTGAV